MVEGKTVLITGASRGLGAALALAFARADARVAICARSAAELERVAATIRREGGACVARTADVRVAAEVEEWVVAAEEELGAPAVLINNASVLGERRPLAEESLEQWRLAVDVNLTGAFIATRLVLPAMLQAAAGSIINVSSGAAVPPRVNWGGYGVSKYALDGFTLNLAEELKQTGVRVNSVDPGAMRTPMRARAYPAEDPSAVKPPADAAGIFLWLASEAARGVTGQRFRADEWRGA